MRRISIIFLLLSIYAIADATYKEGYYNGMEGKRKEALKQATKECVQKHTVLNYTNLPNNWIYTDVYPDLVNGQKRWWEMYSNEVYLIRSGQSGLSSFRANNMQREHSVPKSWWGSDDSSPAWTDIYNLYPSDGSANQAKRNYPLGPVGDPTFDNGVTKVGIPATGYGGTSGYVFEPGDEYKGDFARAYFYVFTVYDNLNWTANSMANRNEYPTLKPWAYELLLQWHRKDPVSQKERDRNDAAERQQGNRNPFIDFPELAEYIWGTKTTEAFYIKDQQGGVTPPITGDPQLTAPVNGEALDFGEVAEGGVVSAPLIINGSNLTSALSVRVTSTDKAMFTLERNTIPASEVVQQGGTKLNVFYKPTALGHHTASVTIYDGGLTAAQQVNVKLNGIAYPIPTLTALTAYDATNVSDTEYTANWSAATDVVDYYIVTRTQYLESGMVTTTHQSDENFLLITGRNTEVSESYYVQSSRLGYTSLRSNVITVAAGGVGALEYSMPLVVGTVSGGFIILSDCGAPGLKVYTPSGVMLPVPADAEQGTFIPLSKGVYIVTARNASKPVKIFIQ